MNSIKLYFDHLAEEWDLICQHDAGIIRCLLGFLNLQPGDRVLDVGTGTGVLIPYLAEKVGKMGKVVALDLSSKMLAKARQKYNYQNVVYREGDLFQLDFGEEKYDFIICYSVFPHLREQKLALNILTNALGTGGKLAILHGQARKLINELHLSKEGEVKGHYLPSAGKVKNWMREAGLSCKECIDNDIYVVIGEKSNQRLKKSKSILVSE